MEASEGNVRGVVDTLTKVVEALDRAGIELISDNATSLAGGRGVRLRQAKSQAAPVDGQMVAEPAGGAKRSPSERRSRK
jgi:hypothetical protein